MLFSNNFSQKTTRINYVATIQENGMGFLNVRTRWMCFVLGICLNIVQ
jgi:hypothetical protein